MSLSEGEKRRSWEQLEDVTCAGVGPLCLGTRGLLHAEFSQLDAEWKWKERREMCLKKIAK